MIYLIAYFIGMIATFLIINHYNDTGIKTGHLFEITPILVAWPLFWILVILVEIMELVYYIRNKD